MQADSIQAGQNVIVVDDLIATGTFTILYSCAYSALYRGVR
jgi:adenine/guanine phosphoribosyltransferase-like PRPP-binding protein